MPPPQKLLFFSLIGNNLDAGKNGTKNAPYKTTEGGEG